MIDIKLILCDNHNYSLIKYAKLPLDEYRILFYGGITIFYL